MIKEILNQLNSQIHGLQEHVLGVLLEITPQLKKGLLDDEEYVDCGFMLKEIEDICDELRKEVKARKELCSSKAAVSRTKACLQDPAKDLTIRGEYATGTPEVRVIAALPKKGTGEYLQFCSALGVPEEALGVLKIDWKAATELFTELRQQGQDLPKGVGREYPQYYIRFRKVVNHGEKENRNNNPES